jgi:hypothetical protein
MFRGPRGGWPMNRWRPEGRDRCHKAEDPGALDAAEDKGRTETATLLREHGAQPAAKL